MRTLPRSPYAGILGLGEYRPATVLTNVDIEARVGKNAGWIKERTGIVARRVASRHPDVDDSVPAMAAAAGSKALAAAGLAPSDVELVVLATCSMRWPLPGGAATVAAQMGATGSGAFDLNAACAGFCYALSVAADAVRTGAARHVLVVGSDRLTDWVNPADRDTASIFGDGAGAAVVGAVQTPGIGPVAWGSDGSRASLIAVGDDAFLHMAGQAVYRWATTELVPVARRACTLAGVEPQQLAALVPHQANLRIVTSLAQALHLPPSVVVADDIVETGNTSAASVPLALARILAEGRVHSGQLALLLGFGAGLTYAGQVVRMP